MILLLCKKVPGLGEPGDVVDISDGYGRNYLLPQRLAVANTPENRASIESERLMWLQREAERKDRAKAAVKALKNALLQVRQKAQADGSLYGSVTAAVVVSVIKQARGIEVEERWVNMLPGVIKKIGDYDIQLDPPNEDPVTFKLTVLPEGE